MPKKKKRVIRKKKEKKVIKHQKISNEELKTAPKKRRVKKVIRYVRAPREESNVERTLIENFVSLQKVMVNLSSKFDNLTNQISKLLGLFEVSAKALAEKDFEIESGNSQENSKILEKIDNIIDQNKIIARGLTLVHEKTIPQMQNYPPAQNNYPPTQSIDSGIPKLPSTKLPNKPVPRVTIPQGDDGEYHKSITSSQPRFNE
jgi:hypothetical protein